MEYRDLHLLIRYAREYGHAQLRQLGVSDTEHTLCAYLFAHGGVSQEEAAEALHIDKTTASRALLGLEEKGFITRRPNPENRRKNLLYLTEAGRRDIAEVVDLNDRWYARVASCLTEAEQTQFSACCKRLLESAEKLSREGMD